MGARPARVNSANQPMPIQENAAEAAHEDCQIRKSLIFLCGLSSYSRQAKNMVTGFVSEDGQECGMVADELRGNVDQYVTIGIDSELSRGFD